MLEQRFIPGKNNLCELTPEGNFSKRFVKRVERGFGYLGSSPYYDIQPDPESFTRELKGHEFHSPYFNVLCILKKDETGLAIDYEFLDNVSRLDKVVEQCVRKGEINTGCVNVNFELGEALRKMHDENYDGKSKTVPGILDFIDNNVFVAHQPNKPKPGYHVIFDFETFDPCIGIYLAVSTMPLSELVSAATLNSNDTEFNARGISIIGPAIEAFFDGYFGESAPLWMQGNSEGGAYDNLREAAILTALGQHLPQKHKSLDKAAVIADAMLSQIE
jgi:hypothetical protein